MNLSVKEEEADRKAGLSAGYCPSAARCGDGDGKVELGQAAMGKGRGMGIAAHRSFLTYVATVVEVEVDSERTGAHSECVDRGRYRNNRQS